MSSPVRVASFGRFAQTALASGLVRVIAVFERSVYVEAPAGLACLGAVGNGPLNARCEMLPPQLRAGESLTVDITEASLWHPRAAIKWNATTIARSLDQLRQAARDRLPSEGFAYLIDAPRKQPDAVLALTRWLAHPTGVPDGAAGLIGLGPGLTPSGDDLIGGALCALHAMRKSGVAARLAGWALPLARSRTSRISYAHLACAAQGECAEAVNDAIVAVIAGEPVDLARIDAIGHTSGWDALAGAMLALAALPAP